MPAWLVWLLPVPVATLAAIAWTAWAGRTRRPVEAVDSVLAYERFRQALNTPVPAPRSEAPGEQKAGSGG
jgi:cytochrome c-type biogenesis protein CcmH/NrfF